MAVSKARYIGQRITMGEECCSTQVVGGLPLKSDISKFSQALREQAVWTSRGRDCQGKQIAGGQVLRFACAWCAEKQQGGQCVAGSEWGWNEGIHGTVRGAHIRPFVGVLDLTLSK